MAITIAIVRVLNIAVIKAITRVLKVMIKIFRVIAITISKTLSASCY